MFILVLGRVLYFCHFPSISHPLPVPPRGHEILSRDQRHRRWNLLGRAGHPGGHPAEKEEVGKHQSYRTKWKIDRLELFSWIKSLVNNFGNFWECWVYEGSQGSSCFHFKGTLFVWDEGFLNGKLPMTWGTGWQHPSIHHWIGCSSAIVAWYWWGSVSSQGLKWLKISIRKENPLDSLDVTG